VITFGYNLVPNGGGLGPSGVPSLTSPFSGVPTPTISFSELALDPVTWDILLPVQILQGPPAVIQKVRQRFRFFKGEWFLDQRLGIPFLQAIFIKSPSQLLVNAIFQQVLAGTPGVASVTSFSSSLDRPSRTLTVDFVAPLVDGSQVVAQAEPFIIGIAAQSSQQSPG